MSDLHGRLKLLDISLKRSFKIWAQQNKASSSKLYT